MSNADYLMVATLPATGTGVGVDAINGVDFQRMKVGTGRPGSFTDVGDGTAMAVAEDSVTAADLLHYVEPLQNVDAAGRIQVGVPAAVIASGVITTVSTVTSVTAVANVATIAGVNQEMFINQAEAAYNQEIAACLSFT